MDSDQLSEWCDEHLPDLYDEGMFDSEELSEEVWAAVDATAAETVLDHLEDEELRDELADELTETARDWFREHHRAMLDAIQPDPATPVRLMTAPQVAQHSAEWYAQRRNRLTASEFAQILDGRRGALLRAKLAPADPSTLDRPMATPIAIAQEDGEMNATRWGHRFEPIVRRIYELELAGVGAVCDTMGRATHATIPWLSASPDGVVISGPLVGRLVEIKSPKSRQPGEFVPLDYYVQMQIQMEVCDVDAVDFVEARFEQRPQGEAAAEAAAPAPWKGLIEVYGHLDAPETWVYRYSEPVEDLEDAVLPPAPTDLPLLESSVWWLTFWHPRTVLRNRQWWANTGLPAAQAFWSEVESGKGASPAATSAGGVAAGSWMGTR
jgi:hypothetical protein